MLQPACHALLKEQADGVVGGVGIPAHGLADGWKGGDRVAYRFESLHERGQNGIVTACRAEKAAPMEE